jgi:hypothetical protein
MGHREKLLIDWKSDDDLNGQITLSLQNGRLQVRSSSEWTRSRIEGLLQPFWRAGQIGELLGTQHCSTAPTWLWPKGQVTLSIGEDLHLALPQDKLATASLAEQLNRLGIGGIILGARSRNAVSGTFEDPLNLTKWVAALQQKGIQVGFRPNVVCKNTTCPLDEKYREQVISSLTAFLEKVPCDLLVWESRYTEERYRKGAEYDLQLDLLRAELQLLESVAPKLLFLFPAVEEGELDQQAKLAMAVAESCGRNSQVACYGADHPVWEKVRSRLAPVGLPLLGIRNSQEGDGEPLLYACSKKQAEGVVIAVENIPKKEVPEEGDVWAWSSGLALQHFPQPLRSTWDNAFSSCVR